MGAHWVAAIREALARLEGSAALAQRGLTAQDMQAGARLPPEQQNEMIRGMVDRLAERLKRDSTDIDGCLRLLRSYAVLGEREKAKDAVLDARKAFGGDAEKLRRLDEGISELGAEL